MDQRFTLVRGAALAVLTFATMSRAEPAAPAAVANHTAAPSIARVTDPRGYSYQFSDDPLAAGGFDAHDARILVASHVIRTTLIRPRTAFVVEMLKSVENL
jgi:hypothetical protein